LPGGFPADACAPWLDGLGTHLHALEPLEPRMRLQYLTHQAMAFGLHTASGQPLRFVAHAGIADYESHIFATGEVPTRIDGDGARHDLYNALAWLRWPHSKARLNALHMQARACVASTTGRGPQRDAATLFDENGLVWIGQDGGLEAALRDFDWPTLFTVRRDELPGKVHVAVFGHALMHKLEAPFKGITAHALPLRMPVQSSHEAVDRALAAKLAAASLQARGFCPLPVMGLPGWSPANTDPAFYQDEQVFRRGRMRRKPALDHRPPDSPRFPPSLKTP
jgi:hypothetical protein